MKLKFVLLLNLILGALFVAPNTAYAKINIFACTPEWGSLATEIGGDHVKVYTATTAQQDVHYLRAKPSMLSAMRKADLVFCNGGGLEIGWLPILMNRAAQPRVQPGSDGFFLAADFIQTIEIPKEIDRIHGDVHPEGNPHIHLYPDNVLKVAGMFTQRLILLDTENKSVYQQNLSQFRQKFRSLITKLESKAKRLKDKQVVVHHPSFSYLLKWLDMNAVAMLEPKPGINPTPTHLEKVLNQIKGKNIHGIIIAPHESKSAAEWFSDKTDIPILSLPFTVGGSEEAQDLFTVYSESVDVLLTGGK